VVGPGVLGSVVDEAASEPVVGVPGVHRHLLDVQVAVDDLGDQVPDGRVGRVDDGPGGTGPLVAGQFVDW
jgi:hypothetical protein